MAFKSIYDDDDDDFKNDDYDDDFFEDEKDEDSDDDEFEEKEIITYYCNDCNYRWQKIYSNKDVNDDIDTYDDSYYDSEDSCPMCGSNEIDRV